VIADPPPPIPRPDVTPELANAISLGLAKDPASRPKTAAAFAALLRPGAAPSDEHADTEPAPIPEPTTVAPPMPAAPVAPGPVAAPPAPTTVIGTPTPTAMPTRVVLPEPTAPEAPRRKRRWPLVIVGVVGAFILLQVAFIALNYLRGSAERRPIPRLTLGVVQVPVSDPTMPALQFSYAGDPKGRAGEIVVACTRGALRNGDTCRGNGSTSSSPSLAYLDTAGYIASWDSGSSTSIDGFFTTGERYCFVLVLTDGNGAGQKVSNETCRAVR